MEKLIPRWSKACKIGPSHDGSADYGPLVTAEAVRSVAGYIDQGVSEGAELVVDGRGFKLQGYENGFYMGGCAVRQRHPRHDHLQGRDFRPGALGGARQDYEEALALPIEAPIRQRRCDLHPRRRRCPRFRRPHEYRHGRRQRADPGSDRLSHLRRLEVLVLRRSQPARPDSIRFYTKTKTMTSRWPSGIKDGAEFVMPTMK
jgi:malonate-semialdehyde dehydrogenase (acetylating) / methylmalonate-semialdehyde dehydrogenase